MASQDRVELVKSVTINRIVFGLVVVALLSILVSMQFRFAASNERMQAKMDDFDVFLKSDNLIVMWSGLPSTIPNGWAICDGENGIDMRGTFPRATSDGQAAGARGGSDVSKLSIENVPEHDHCNGNFCMLSEPINNNGWKPSYHQAQHDGRQIESRNRAQKVGAGKEFPNIPSYTALHFICKKR